MSDLEKTPEKEKEKSPGLHHKAQIWMFFFAYTGILVALSFYYRIWTEWPGLKTGCALTFAILLIIPLMVLGVHTETRWSEEERMKKDGIKGTTRYDKGPAIKYMWFVKVTIPFFIFSLVPLLAEKIPENAMTWIEGLQGLAAVFYGILLLIACYIAMVDPSKEDVKWMIITIFGVVILIFGIGAWAFIADSFKAFPKSFLPMGYLIVVNPYVLIRTLFWWKGQHKFIVIEPGRIYVKGLGTKDHPDIEFTKEQSDVQFYSDDPIEEKGLNVGNNKWNASKEINKEIVSWEAILRTNKFQQTKNEIQTIRSQVTVVIA